MFLNALAFTVEVGSRMGLFKSDIIQSASFGQQALMTDGHPRIIYIKNIVIKNHDMDLVAIK